MRIGELFAGIGGLGLGLEWSGLGPVAWQVEQNEYARQVLAHHWPDARRYEDVKQVGAHNLAPVDIICGGFPCQDISLAGAGAGIEGERSGLWKEFARVIREMGPRYVVVENVPAITARGLGVVLGDLAECGYDAVWDCISAASVGAPHIRDRLFIVAHTPGDRWGEGSNRISRSVDSDRTLQGSPGRNSERGTVLAHANSKGLEKREELRRAVRSELPPTFRARGKRGCEWWAVEPPVGRVAHGVPSRVDRLRCLGNAVVPHVSQVIGGVIIQLETRRLACQSTR